MNSSQPGTDHHAFLQGGGEVASLIAMFDWSATSLGAISQWPQHVKTSVALMLRSPVAIVTLWGEAGVMIYNDAYSRFAGGRHPQLLGSNVRDAWDEVAAFNDNMMRVCMAGGTLTYVDQELTLFRSGMPEQVWMNLDYSAIMDEQGCVVGVIAFVVETSAKVRAERRLSSEHERLHKMFAQAPGFMALLDGPEHVITLANQAYLNMVGQRHVLGKTVRTALPEAAEQGFVALLDHLYVTGEAHTGTAVPFSVQANGEGFAKDSFMDFVYQPMLDDNGAVSGVFVQGVDVTQRVLAEQAVKGNEAMFRTLAQAMPNQVWAASASGSLNWFNAQVYHYSGAKPGTLDGDKWGAIVHPDDRDTSTQLWRQSVKLGLPYEIEMRVRRADGVYRWHLARALPIRDDRGVITRWIGTNTDIEDQRATSDALAQQVELRTAERDRMWRMATDIMLVADIEARIVAVNPAFTHHLGWSESEVIGTSFIALVHSLDREAIEQEALRLKLGDGTFKLENRIRRKDGGYSILSWSGATDKKFIHAIGRDKTVERAAAEALKHTEQALQQAQKMETIGKLTGGVAHDFNNLLQVISGNLQMLAVDTAGNARAEKRVAGAMGGVARGAKLASYLLAFGRRQALEPKVVKIGRFVVAMEDMLLRSLGEEIDLEIVVSGGLWNTLADTAQVENTILNLCINARDAMDGAGKLTIEVGNALLDVEYARRHAEVEPGQYVMIAVSDTGGGMSAEVLAQAFEPFFSTKPEGKGTGLGLSMVYGFVKQSGGHVKIYSEQGYGTTVKLYLPRSMETEDAPTPVDVEPIVRGTETILVAEDDEGVRTTVVEMLRELGYHVLKANDAASALNIIDSGLPIDLLFTDVVMPGPLRSPELARKARERLPGLAVLFTSGYTENAIVHGGRLDAGVDLLGKPYTREALAKKIRFALSKKKQIENTSEAALAPSRLPPETPITMSGVRILVVEDNELIRQNTVEILRELGHVVRHVENAEQAIVELHMHSCDILMTDLSLPGMSGEALALHAKALLPQLKVIFASGRPQDEPVPGAILLRKPYELSALIAALSA